MTKLCLLFLFFIGQCGSFIFSTRYSVPSKSYWSSSSRSSSPSWFTTIRTTTFDDTPKRLTTTLLFVVEPRNDFTNLLTNHLDRKDASLITVEGYVIAKRSLGKQLIFVDFQTINGDLCQAMLRKDYFDYDGGGDDDDHNHYDGFKRCLLKGTKLQVTGIASPTRNPGNAVLLLRSMKLIGFPRQRQHIQIILRQGLLEKSIPIEQVTKTLAAVVPADNSNILPPTSNDENTIKQWLKELAKRIFDSLPEDPAYPIAADQKEISRRGNYVVPEAPVEWQDVPQDLILLSSINDKSGNDVPSIIPPTMDSIQQALKEENTTFFKSGLAPSPILSMTGWVQNRRRFDGNITMVSLVDTLTLLSQDNHQEVDVVAKNRLSCLLHPRLVSQFAVKDVGWDVGGGGDEIAEMYQNLLAVGARVWVSGKFRYDSITQKRILWIHDIQLVQSSSGSVTIRYLLDLLYHGKMDVERVGEALLLPLQETKSVLAMDATERQWKANQLAIILQQSQKNSANTVFKPELLKVMEKYQYLMDRHPVIPTDISGRSSLSSTTKEEQAKSQKISNRTDESSSSSTYQPRLMPIGMPGSKWESKKRPQLEWMGQQIRAVLESHPEYGKRKLSILDIGGGKGSLAHYLGKSLQDHVHIHVVDICQGAVTNGANKASKLQLPVAFQWADATSSNILTDIPADVVVALHACGHLSDVALAHAIHRRAGFVLVPCCFNSNPHLTIPGLGGEGDGDLPSSLSSSSSSSSSTPSPVTTTTTTTKVTDWLNVPPEDWSALKLLAEVQGDITLASRAIGAICAIRAETAQKRLHGGGEGEDIDISIRSFPIQYSTRNTVLVGTFRHRGAVERRIETKL